MVSAYQGLFDRIIYGLFCRLRRFAPGAIQCPEEANCSDRTEGDFFEGIADSNVISIGMPYGRRNMVGAIGENVWFGELEVAGHVLHPLTLLFGVYQGSLINQPIRIPKL